MSTPDVGTQLALERTWLAHERTTMAWVRTAASLISFGFTIYKFFQLDLRGETVAHQPAIGPRGFALMMIGIGIMSLILATIQHHQAGKRLRMVSPDMPRSVAGIVAWLVGLLGIVALMLVILRQ